MKFTVEDHSELAGHSKHHKELADTLLDLHRFVESALLADELPDNWWDEYEQKLHWFMVLFAAKFADAPNKGRDASSETTGSRSENRETTEADSGNTEAIASEEDDPELDSTLEET